MRRRPASARLAMVEGSDVGNWPQSQSRLGGGQIQVGAARRPPPPDRPSLDGQASPEGEAEYLVHYQ